MVMPVIVKGPRALVAAVVAERLGHPADTALTLGGLWRAQQRA
jgi:hypothetical protein